MKRRLFILISLVLIPLPFSFAIEDGEFKYGDQYWSQYVSSESSVAFYPDPMPDPYVRILAHGSQGYAGIYQKELQQSKGFTRAVFHLKSISAGLGGIITVGWTDETGDFGSYWKETSSPGTYTVDCGDTNYPYVTVQADSTYIVNSIVEVDQIEVIDASVTPTPTFTPTPTPTPEPTPPIDLYTRTCGYLVGKKDLSPEEKEQADWNNDGKLDVADIIDMRNALSTIHNLPPEK